MWFKKADSSFCGICVVQKSHVARCKTSQANLDSHRIKIRMHPEVFSSYWPMLPLYLGCIFVLFYTALWLNAAAQSRSEQAITKRIKASCYPQPWTQRLNKNISAQITSITPKSLWSLEGGQFAMVNSGHIFIGKGECQWKEHSLLLSWWFCLTPPPHNVTTLIQKSYQTHAFYCD